MGKGDGQGVQGSHLRVIPGLLWYPGCISDIDERRKIDVVALVVDVAVPLFLMELDASSRRLWQDSMNGPTPDVPIEDVFSLYRRTRVMMNIYSAFCPKSVCFSHPRLVWFDHPWTAAILSSTLAASSSHMSSNGWLTQMTRQDNGSKLCVLKILSDASLGVNLIDRPSSQIRWFSRTRCLTSR